MRKLLWLLLLTCPAAWATTYNIPAGSSLSTIISTIQTAAAASGSNTVQVAAGTYNIPLGNACMGCGGTISISPCPSGSLLITGPTTTYGQRGVVGSWNARPTAILRNSNNGANVSVTTFFNFNNCSNISIEYLELDGNHPYSGGGFFGAGGSNSNLTIKYNYAHGMNVWTPYLVGGDPYPVMSACSGCSLQVDDDQNSTSIYLGGGSGQTDTNVSIQYNIFGNPVNPGNNDCGMGATTNASSQGMMIWTGSYWNYNVNASPQYQNSDAYGGDGGFCSAMWQETNLTNLNFTNNIISNLEEGVKGVEGSYQLVNANYQYNDLGWIHHSYHETQMEANNISQPSTWQYNDEHDPYAPGDANWGNSTAQNQFSNLTDNLIITNQSGHNAMPPSFESWGNGQITNNLWQGQNTCGITFYMNSAFDNPSLPSALKNNTFQLNDGQAFADWCSFTPTGQSTTLGLQSESEPGQTNSNAPAISGNVWTTSYTQQTSVAPTLSPSGGTFSGSQVVTLTDAGNSSNPMPRGNTGIWCTRDGSTPSPFGSTSAYYATGDTITLTSNTTLKCVGMWGAYNQPAPAGTSGAYVSYPSGGYGYVPSGVVTGTYTFSGAAPTLTSVALSETGQTLSVGQSAQVTATCTYSNGTTTNCTTTDTFGNIAGTWTSSNTSAATISSAGLITGAGAGSTNVTAKVGSVTSPALPITVTAATPTLTSVNITDGGIGSIAVAQTVQASATAVYNGGAITTNCSAAADQYGTVCGTWTSSTPAAATISSTGLITGVAVGTANLTVKATNSALSFTSTALALTITSNTPPAATLTGVTVSCGSGSITAGSTISCAATCAYSDSSTTNCTSTDAHGNSVIGNWLSSNTAIATINASTGVVTAVAAGSTSSNVDTSLTGWSTCVIGNCSAGGSPGGSGTPTAYSQTINNSSPAGAPFGTSMLLSQTANVSNTNALWTFKSPSTCDTCTALASSFSVYLGTNSAQASAFEFDNFNFSVAAGKNYMAGHQYNQVTGKWQVFNGATGSWVNTSVTNFIANASWHSIAFSDSVTTCSGAAGIQFNSVTIDGVAYAINLCEPVAALPSNYTSAVGTQFQIDIGTITGSQTVTENIAAVNFTAGGSTAALPAVTNITAKAGAYTSPVFPLTVTPVVSGNILGQAIFDTAGFTYPNALVATYAISPATPSNVSYLNFYIAPLSPPALVAGNQYDVILTMAPTATTQSIAATCTATYTTVGTTADYGWHQLPVTNCGSIPGNTGYWVGTVIKNAGPEGLGFYDCGSATNGCNGGAPTGAGPGTYHFWIASVNYGSYTNMTPTMVNPVQAGTVPLQASAYATLTSPVPTLIGGYLTASITPTAPTGINFLFTGQTAQMASFCSYSDGTTTACTTPDIWGNTVLTWRSSNTAAVTIGAVGSTHPGLATAVGPGVSNITAVLGGGANAAIEVTVGGSFGQ